MEGKTGKAMVTIAAGTATKVTVAGNSTVMVNGTLLSAMAYDAKNRELTGPIFTWQVDDLSLATVSTSGLVAALLPARQRCARRLDGTLERARFSWI